MKSGYDETTSIQAVVPPPPRPRRGHAFVTVLAGAHVGCCFEIPPGQSTLGRSIDAEVRLDDEGISRLHAKIIRDLDGSAKLVDLGSTNGTFINGRRIHAEGLREGDRIRMGQLALLDFRYEYRDDRECESEPNSVQARRHLPSDQLGSYDHFAGALNNLGKVYAKQGKHTDAVATYRRTLQIREMKFGRNHSAVATILDTLGSALQSAGEPQQALPCYQRALHIHRRQNPPRRGREVGHIMVNLAECQLRLNDGEAALELLEQAYALLVDQGASALELARARFVMARALGHLGRDRPRMLELGRLARDAFCHAGAANREQLDQTRRWLAAAEAPPVS